MVEIEIDVVQPVVLEAVERALVRLLDGFLVPLLVDEVDEDLRAVLRDLLVKVPRERLDLSIIRLDAVSATNSESLQTGLGLTVEERSMILRSGLYRRLLISAQ